MGKIYLNDIGGDVILDTGVNIGTVAFNYIKYLKADGSTEGTWASALYSSYSKIAEVTGTYLLKYTIASGDLDQVGRWKMQAYVGAADGTWSGETVDLMVYNEYQ